MSNPPPRALTIAGSDSGGGAGIQADLKTFHELGVFGMSVLTALTAQNTTGVHGVHVVPADFVQAQLDAVTDDIGVDAAKTGMLATADVIKAVADGVRAHGIDRLVVDPVCASKHGHRLLAEDAIASLRDEILPLAEVATPNLGEVKVLTGLVSLIFFTVVVSSLLELPVLGTVKASTALPFDMGVYLVVVGLVLAVLRSLGHEEDELGEGA